jgi:hypothetical protein
MFSNIDFTQKNKFFTPAIIVLVIVCWFLAFNKTYQTIKIYYQLNSDIQPGKDFQDLSFNPKYNDRKLRALNDILKSYDVNKKQWSNDVWLSVSSLAASQKVAVDFTATKPPIEVDSNSVGVKQTFLFYGDYLNLVKLLDTLEHTSKIGRISGLLIKVQKEDINLAAVDKCKLEVTLQGL